MSLLKLLKSHNIEKYENSITVINRINDYSNIEIIDLDDILKNNDVDKYNFINNFVNNIVDIYAYKHTKESTWEYFHLIGKLDDNKYFWHYYSFCTDFYSVDLFTIEIVYSNDINKVINYETGIPEDIIKLKPFDKL